MARPSKNIDTAKIVELASNGMVVREIAVILDVSESTLSHRYRAFVEKGRELCNSRLRSKQVERALHGSDTMLIWLGKNRLEQTDKQDLTSGGQAFAITVKHIGNRPAAKAK